MFPETNSIKAWNSNFPSEQFYSPHFPSELNNNFSVNLQINSCISELRITIPKVTASKNTPKSVQFWLLKTPTALEVMENKKREQHSEKNNDDYSIQNTKGNNETNLSKISLK